MIDTYVIKCRFISIAVYWLLQLVHYGQDFKIFGVVFNLI